MRKNPTHQFSLHYVQIQSRFKIRHYCTSNSYQKVLYPEIPISWSIFQPIQAFFSISTGFSASFNCRPFPQNPHHSDILHISDMSVAFSCFYCFPSFASHIISTFDRSPASFSIPIAKLHYLV